MKILALGGLIFLLPATALAADVRIGESLIIPSNEFTSDNLYVTGGEVTVSGTSGKDLIVAGGKVIVNGVTQGDILIVGGSSDVLERTQGDVRVIGGQLNIGAPVQGDLIAIGGRIHLTKGGSIAGDVLVLGGEVIIDGAVNGTIEAYAGSITINSLVGGDIKLNAGESVTFGESAVIGNAIQYTAPSPATVHEKAKLGDVTYTESAVPKEVVDGTGIAVVLATIAGVMLIIKFFAYLTAAIILAVAFKRLSTSVVNQTLASFWSAVGIGLVTFLVAPVVILIVAFTVIGLVAAAIIATLYVFVLVMSAVYAGFILGGLISKLAVKEASANWKWAALGTFALSLISLIPVVGWVVTLLFFLAALGTLAQALYKDAHSKM